MQFAIRHHHRRLGHHPTAASIMAVDDNTKKQLGKNKEKTWEHNNETTLIQVGQTNEANNDIN